MSAHRVFLFSVHVDMVLFLPSLDTINLQVYPPNAWDAQHKPKHHILYSRAHGYPLKNAKEDEGDAHDEGQATNEDTDVYWRPEEARWRGWDG